MLYSAAYSRSPSKYSSRLIPSVLGSVMFVGRLSKVLSPRLPDGALFEVLHREGALFLAVMVEGHEEPLWLRVPFVGT